MRSCRLVLVVLAGCTGATPHTSDDPCEPLAEVPPSVEIGTGATAFEPLTDGDDLDVVRTPQGLLAVYGSLHATGLHPGVEADLSHPDNPRVTFEVFDGDTWMGGYVDLPRPLHALGATEGELVGDVLALDPEMAYDVEGRPAELRVEVVDACGSIVHSARRVLLQQAF